MTAFPYYDDGDIKIINKIGDLFNNINDFENKYSGGNLYFRGLNNVSYSLQPTAGRDNYYKHAGKTLHHLTPEQEKKLLDRFKRYAYNQTQRILDDWEALFLARHHGLPVRLLDWTSNPLVALYNAVYCKEKPSNDGVVWVFRRIEDDSNDIKVLDEKKSPFNIRGVKIIYPIYNTPRLVAQSGYFTLHQNPQISLENENPDKYNSDEFDILYIRKWRVPYQNKTELLIQLERMAINTRTLYPDLDGLAKGLWQLEVIRKY